MAHVRKQVRDEVATRLGTIDALAEVTSNRGGDLLLSHLPAAVVQTLVERSGQATKAAYGVEPLERRTIQLAVVVVLDAEMEELDDAADALAAAIEPVVAEDGRLGGIAKRVDYVGMDLDVQRDEDGDRWFGFMALEWEVEVWTARGTPETAR